MGARQARGARPHRHARPRRPREGQRPHLQPRHAAADAAAHDEDIAGVLTYIRRESDWEHTASPVDAKFIEGVRAKNAGRVAMWTMDELKKGL
jgi:hypothetical protein